MAQPQAALNARSVAAAALKESSRDLTRYKDSANPSRRLLQQKYDKVEFDKNNLSQKHYTYAEKANIDLETDDEQETWLNAKLDPIMTLLDEVFVILEQFENTDLQTRETLRETTENAKMNQEIRLAELQCQSDARTVKQHVESIVEYVSEVTHSEKEHAEAARTYLKLVEESFADLIKSWNVLKQLPIEEARLNTSFASEEEIKKSVADARVAASEFIHRIDPDDSTETRSNVGSETASSNTKEYDAIQLKSERIQNPKFTGDIRAFANFKADFEKIVATRYSDKSHQAYVMKQSCLVGECKKLVENMNDIDKIWERLEARYGDSTEIVNVIVRGVEKFQFINNQQDRGMIRLVDQLEKGVQDLEAINSVHELANAYTVHLLETKLPRGVFNRWMDKEADISSGEDSDSSDSPNVGKKRFRKILKFLLKERKHSERALLIKDKEKDKPNHLPPPGGGKKFSAGVGGGSINNPNNKCLIHPNAAHLTRKCHKFLSMNVEERGALVKNAKGCKLCLSNFHQGQPCPFLDKWQKCDVQGCKEAHSRLLHGYTQIATFHIQRCNFQFGESCSPLLLMQEIATPQGSIVGFWDGGSTLCLISRECAKRLNLVGINVVCELLTVGGSTTIMNTILYEVRLIDRDDEIHTLRMYEIEDICGKIEATSVESLTHFFPYVTEEEIARPVGSVDVLIGMENADIHPHQIDWQQGLVLYESRFGSGKIVGGVNKSIQSNDQINARVRQCAQAKISNVRVLKIPPKPPIDFFSAEQFGVSPPPRCNRCKQCRNCSYETQELCEEAKRALDMIRNNLVLNPIENKWTTVYPYKCDPSVLQNNESQVRAMVERTEKRMMNNRLLHEKYHEQVQALIKSDVLVEITNEEATEYKGPVFYANMHEVYKPGSTSTPVRLVINSSLRFCGVSFNDILHKGPNSLNNLFGIQLKFRTFLYALVCDMSKMYHSIHTTEMEKHLRRILYRENPNDEFKVYGITRAMFGDRPAAAITAEAIKETAHIYQHIDEEAARKIQEETYVDDTTTGADTMSDINRLKVKIAEILAKGGFKVKGFVATGDSEEEVIALIGSGESGHVLGILWYPATDEFSIVVRINVSKKFKGARAEKDLSIEEIPRLLEIIITLRILLGITNSCYDAYGLISPITIQMKIELRILFKPEMGLGWDDAVPRDIVERWVRILQLLKSVENIRFRRCIKPCGEFVGKPILIICNDGSDEAMCATAHVRWTMKDGTYQCFLYASKTRVTPLKKETTPRIEMQSAVLGARLAKTIRAYSGLEFEDTVHITDSTCTMATLQNTTTPLRDYMGNRKAEVLSNADASKFFHIRSKLNISDLGTRTDATAADLSEDSDWQIGTEWMRLPRSRWPVTQDPTGAEIPKEEIRKVHIGAVVVTKHFFDMTPYKGKSYLFVLRLMTLLLRVFKCKSFNANCEIICAAEIKLAETFCVRNSMVFTQQEFEAGTLRSLGAQVNENGIICVNSRAQEAMSIHYDNDEFPILVYKDPLSYIFMMSIHNEDHSGVTRTVNKSRRKFWIVRARRLAHNIKQRCFKCRLLDIQLAKQKMAPLPTNRTKIAAAFYCISLDLFGPIIIYDIVKKRTRMKVWGVIFNCTVSRAIHIDLTADYSTDEILQTIMRFTSLRGCPGEIHSDEGSQLIAAAKELDIVDFVDKWDWKPIKEWAAGQRIKWTVAPAEGHHQNGLSESMIRSVKRTLKHKITDNVLTFGQLQTVMFQVADIINSRPIAIVNGTDPEHPAPITPNHLILGRATSEAPQGNVCDNDSKNISKKFRYLQSLVADWWREWYATVFPYLVPNYKWLQRHRNVKVGDVCLVRYKNEIQANYRLARVQDVRVGKDGLVRTVLLKYKLPGENTFRTVDRAVQGISVIVPVEEQSTLNPTAPEFDPSDRS